MFRLRHDSLPSLSFPIRNLRNKPQGNLTAQMCHYKAGNSPKDPAAGKKKIRKEKIGPLRENLTGFHLHLSL